MSEALGAVLVSFLIGLPQFWVLPKLYEAIWVAANAVRDWPGQWIILSLVLHHLLWLFVEALPTCINFLVVCLLVWYIVFYRHVGSWNLIGLSRFRLCSNLMIGALVGIGARYSVKLLVHFIRGDPFFITRSSPDHLIMLFSDLAFGGILSAISQELLFVGLFYQALRSRMHPFLAGCCGPMIFALWHFPLKTYFQLPFLFLHGVIAILLFEKRKTLVAPIAFHATYNFLGRF